MNIITVSREFGSGGRELAKRLADHLGYDYYDREIISLVAKDSGLDADYIEETLTNGTLKDQSLSFCRTFTSASYSQSSKVNLLLAQKEVIERIAQLGRNFVIVGRNADIILEKYAPFNVFVCASSEAKLKRCIERAPSGENMSEKELLRRMKQIDRQRCEIREIMSPIPWGRRDAYELTINTTGWNIKELVPILAEFASCRFGREK